MGTVTVGASGSSFDSATTLTVSISTWSASTNANFTVNGTCYITAGWPLASTSASALCAAPTSGTTINGAGIWIAGTTGVNLSHSFALSAVNAGGDGTNSAVGSAGKPYINSMTSIAGSAAGQYSIGIHDTTAGTFIIFVWIYIGGTRTYTVSVSIGANAADTTGDTIKLRNISGSVGNLTTLVGTIYV